VAEATRPLGAALRRWEALDDSHGLGFTLLWLGHAAAAAGDAAAAGVRYADALRCLQAAGDAQFAGFVRCFLGVNAWQCGATSDAVAQVRAVVWTSVALRDRWLLAVAPASGGGAHRGGRRVHRAGAAARGGGRAGPGHGRGIPLGGAAVRAGRGGTARAVHPRGGVGPAYRQGRALPFGDVAALALSMLDEIARDVPDQQSAPATTPSLERPSRHPSSLTSREQEVLRLVAEGLSSKAIARQLFLAPSTVNYHVRSVFNKLGVDTRAQAVAVGSTTWTRVSWSDCSVLSPGQSKRKHA